MIRTARGQAFARAPRVRLDRSLQDARQPTYSAGRAQRWAKWPDWPNCLAASCGRTAAGVIVARPTRSRSPMPPLQLNDDEMSVLLSLAGPIDQQAAPISAGGRGRARGEATSR